MKSCLVMLRLSFIGRDMFVEYWWLRVEEAKRRGRDGTDGVRIRVANIQLKLT